MYYNYDQLPYLTCRPPSTPSKRSLSCKNPSRLQKKLLSKTDSAIELVGESNKNSSWNGIPSLENHFQLPCSDQHWKSFTNQTITAPFYWSGWRATSRFLPATPFQQQRTTKSRKVLHGILRAVFHLFFLFSFLAFSLMASSMHNFYPQNNVSWIKPFSKQTCAELGGNWLIVLKQAFWRVSVRRRCFQLWWKMKRTQYIS